MLIKVIFLLNVRFLFIKYNVLKGSPLSNMNCNCVELRYTFTFSNKRFSRLATHFFVLSLLFSNCLFHNWVWDFLSDWRDELRSYKNGRISPTSWKSLNVTNNVFTFLLCPSEGSLHSSDSVSDSSPPPAVVQTGVPTQVVQQVQTAQQVKICLRIQKHTMKLMFQWLWKLSSIYLSRGPWCRPLLK